MTKNREHAHELIDQMPETQLSGVIGFLETILDPALAALRGAPNEDEEISDAEQEGAAEAREWLRNNGDRGIPHAEAMRRLGLE